MSVWNLFAGYVIIEIKGTAAESFINSIITEQYEIWSIKRIPNNRIRACVSIHTFFAIRQLRARYYGRCTVKLVSKNGLLFTLSALRERKLLLYGWLIPLIALIILSGSLWRIEITGCDIVDESFILKRLNSSGIAVGMRTASINTMSLANELCICDDRIAFASVCLKGITLYIDIKETDSSIRVQSASIAGSIYAKKDGVIKRIVIKNGLPMVNAGDAVKRGDELISGILAQTTSPVNAEGNVLAQVLYGCAASVGPLLEKNVRGNSGYPQVKVFISNIFCLSEKAKYAASEYEIESQVELKGFFIPLTAQRGQIYEIKKALCTADESELQSEAINAANTKLIAVLPQGARLLSKSTTITRCSDGSVQAQIVATTLEDIATNEREP